MWKVGVGGILSNTMLLLRILGYIWALPHTVIGLLISPLYQCRRWRWSEGCLEAIADENSDGSTRILGKPGAQTWGWLIFYANTGAQNNAGLRVHERIHVIQAWIGGPFYILAYVFHWFWLMVFTPAEPRAEPRWKRAYRGIWAERMAYRIQGEFNDGKRPGAWGSRDTRSAA